MQDIQIFFMFLNVKGHRDLHLLTVGKETYTPDQRFQSVHNPHTNDWALKILYPQQKDSGGFC